MDVFLDRLIDAALFGAESARRVSARAARSAAAAARVVYGRRLAESIFAVAIVASAWRSGPTLGLAVPAALAAAAYRTGAKREAARRDG